MVFSRRIKGGVVIFRDLLLTMRHQNHLLILVSAFLSAGCVSSHHSSASNSEARERAAIQQRIAQITDAAEKKDFDRLDSYHLYGPKFTKYSTKPPERQDAEMARRGEHEGLGAAKDLAMSVQDLKIDLFGNTAVTTSLLKYSFTAGDRRVEKQARTTLIFVKDKGQWKIAHEHLSE
jgi:ketosteroid isomerase-like protein